MIVIQRKGIHISNFNLVNEIDKAMAFNGKNQRSGLYCHRTQMSLKFLSLERMDEPEIMEIDTHVTSATLGGEVAIDIDT
jgi:hypothetical protein